MNDKADSSPPRETGATDDTPLEHSSQSKTPTRGWWRGWFKPRNGTSARETLEELLEEREEDEVPIDENEKTLLANILELRDQDVEDVMVPRADIVGVEARADLERVIDIMTREGHSRIPVYRETLDDAVGMVHIKDVVAWKGADEDFSLVETMRRVLFVAPSMRVLELLLEMRVTRCHMALVVDEYGGIDGLVTIEDLVEEIVGEIEDEHDVSDEPDLRRFEDGSFVAEARVEIETFEAEVGPFANDEEREYVDTLGGLVFSLAGRVPIRGELVKHPAGLEFEVLDADPRRIKRLRVRKVEVVADDDEAA